MRFFRSFLYGGKRFPLGICFLPVLYSARNIENQKEKLRREKLRENEVSPKKTCRGTLCR